MLFLNLFFAINLLVCDCLEQKRYQQTRYTCCFIWGPFKRLSQEIYHDPR